MPDGVHLPERDSISTDALRVHLVEHQPAADAHAGLRMLKGRQPIFGPGRMLHANAWRDLHYDAARLLVVRLFREPDVIVLVLRVARVTVGRLGNLESISGDVPFYLYGRAFISRRPAARRGPTGCESGSRPAAAT